MYVLCCVLYGVHAVWCACWMWCKFGEGCRNILMTGNLNPVSVLPLNQKVRCAQEQTRGQKKHGIRYEVGREVFCCWVSEAFGVGCHPFYRWRQKPGGAGLKSLGIRMQSLHQRWVGSMDLWMPRLGRACCRSSSPASRLGCTQALAMWQGRWGNTYRQWRNVRFHGI